MKAAKSVLSSVSLRAMASSVFLSGGLSDERREVRAALLEVPILVEGGAGGREEHRVAGAGELRRPGNGRGHRDAPLDLDLGAEGPLDGLRRFADREDPPRGAGGERAERRE